MVHDNLPDGGEGDTVAAALSLTASMAEEQDIVAMLRQGLALCVKVLDCDRSLLISESDDGRTRILERAGAGGGETAFSTTALRLVNEKKKPLLISDTIGDEVLGTQESINRNDIRSVLCSGLDMGGSAFPDSRVFLYLDSHTDRHPFSMDDLEKFRILSLLMGSLVRKSELLAEQEATIEELRLRAEEKQFEDLVFGSDVFRRCLRLVEQGAKVDVPVLLLGETGTGKEMLARLLHKLSPRKDGPFLAVNCGALPGNLIESHLFGHEKGSFTGAVAMKKGYFEEASGGTLFLDEVGELPPQAQSQFLRVLQEGEVMRVGSSRTILVDVRIVAATNADLDKAATEGRFRKDLYYRLNVLPVRIPAVRERGEDALLLARFFLKKFCETLGRPCRKFSREAEKAILAHEWPGNVREIENHVQRAVITAEGPTLNSTDLGLALHQGPGYQSLREAREAVDREMIGHALGRAPGNLTNAAGILGIDRKSLRLLLEKYDISHT